MKITQPYITETSVFPKQVVPWQLAKMLLGVGVSEVYLMEMATGCFAVGKESSLALGIFSFLFWGLGVLGLPMGTN